MKDALYKLIITAVIAVVALIIYVIYMVASGGGSFAEVIGFVMAMGNTYGILLITLLLGNGLVAVPVYLWNIADVERELQNIYLAVSLYDE